MRLAMQIGFCALLGWLALAISPAATQEKQPDGWIALFNGKDTTGWKLKSDTYTLTKFVDADGTVIKGAKEAKLDQKTEIQDAKGKPIAGAKMRPIPCAFGNDAAPDTTASASKRTRLAT